MSVRATLPILVLVAAAAAAAAARADSDIFPFAIHQTTLDNGLEVVTIPYDSPGVVAYVTIVRTGSRDEVEAGHTGFAHFFEHMMFRGTERFSEAAYNDVLKRMGADSNATTSDDRTLYYIIGPASELETMADIESDRFKHLSYGEDVFRREALAVLGEYNKSVSNPFLPMYERMRDLAFRAHTYKHTTIGFLDDIRAMPGFYDYSRSFFRRFYRPDNTILLVVGDVEAERVDELAARYYGDWKPGYEPPAIASEPPPEGPAEDHVAWPAPIRPHLMIGFRAPAFSADSVDTATLDVIGQLLFSESAPLYQQLVVDEQLVDTLAGSYSDHRDPYLFTVFSRIKSNDQIDRVRQTILEHIAKLEQEGVDEERLERVKSHLRNAFALQLDSPGSVAFVVSHYLTLTGDPETIHRLFEQYARVTPDDVQRVAQQVFRPSGRTTITLSHPQSPTPKG